MKMKAKDYIEEFIDAQGIDCVFELTGGMITQILDSIYKIGTTQIVSMHHEQAVAFAADAYGRITGKVGVGLATSGPGATNLITGIASCYFDSSPAIFITGQVNLHEQRGEKKVRQLGFQETDIVAMVEGITKKSYRVIDAQQLTTILPEAYDIAVSGRPGPVLIDLPMNLQYAEIEVEPLKPLIRNKIPSQSYAAEYSALIEALKTAKRPLILAGGGINSARATNEFLQLINKLQIPVVTSLLGIDTIPYEHPLRVGFIGSYGNRWANLALGTADLLIVLGSRLDIRQTGADTASFSQGKKIFHIDCDPHEVNNRLAGCVPLILDLADFVKHMLSLVTEEIKSLSHHAWIREINELKATWPDTEELKNIVSINPNVFMHALSSQSHEAASFVVDVGNHQMWAAQSLEIAAHQFFITSGGMGAMGFSLPAAIGASLAHAKKPVIVIVGDGSFQVNIQELQTIVQNKLPIKMVVINNNCLGMIRQFQDNYFEERYQSTYWGYSAPNFESVAKAYGIRAKTISLTVEIEKGVAWLWEDNDACLLQVMVDMRANAYPKIAFGKPITEMEPFATPLAMEGT
jgi:acetolactate synthase-1/2/3 large subunit